MPLQDDLGLVTLYQALVDAGIKVSNHYSDLYYPVTPQTTEILSRYPDLKRISVTFYNKLTNSLYYETPFQYLPFWESLTNDRN